MNFNNIQVNLPLGQAVHVRSLTGDMVPCLDIVPMFPGNQVMLCPLLKSKMDVHFIL